MENPTPTLYIKQGCPYCDEAIEFLDEHGIEYRLKEVLGDASAFEEMRKVSGQSKAPTLEWNGKVLADFGADELPGFLRGQNVEMEDS